MTVLHNSYNIVDTDETKRGQAFIFEMNTEKKSLSNSEKMKRWREEKIKKKRVADKKHYEQIREHKIAKVKESRDHTKGRLQKVTTRATHKSQQNKNSKSRERKQKQEENLEAEKRRNS